VPSQIGDLGLGSPGQHPHSTDCIRPEPALSDLSRRSKETPADVESFHPYSTRRARPYSTRRARRSQELERAGFQDFDDTQQRRGATAAIRGRLQRDRAGCAAGSSAFEAAESRCAHVTSAATTVGRRFEVAEWSGVHRNPPFGPCAVERRESPAVTPTAEPSSGRRRFVTRSARRGAPARLRAR
jgi:hypothetical protein